MSEVGVVERMRMAIAEAGYDPSVVHPSSWPGISHEIAGYSVPDEVIWKARELASAASPCCFACYVLEEHPLDPPCQATRRFEQDCGVDRSPVGCREDEK